MKRIVIYFLTWKFIIYTLLFFSLAEVSLRFNFLGGGISNYLKNPFIWSFANFDGEHYLAIAREGYRSLTYFYFPLYPLIIRFVSYIISEGGLLSTTIAGLIISNTFFLLSLFGLYKLTRLDYSDRISHLALLLLMLFPTSVYFGCLYNESMFLALTVWSFYFSRKKKWILAGILGAFATATRVVGIAIFPALLTEVYLQWKKNKSNPFLPLICSLFTVSGIAIYAIYLYFQTGDYLEFVHSVEIFGQQRSSNLVLLPQVFYRYFFKILPNINYSYFPIVFSTYLELLSALAFGLLAIASFFKLRLSYALYALITYLIPSLSGSFSSYPRYVLIIFPVFILSALHISEFNKYLKLVIFVILFLLMTITTSLFMRGYWIS